MVGSVSLSAHGVEFAIGNCFRILGRDIATTVGSFKHVLQQSPRDLAAQRLLDQLVSGTAELARQIVDAP